MTAQTTVYVSDHAVLRYIQRHYGVDVEKVRRQIEAKALPAAQMGAAVFGFENLKFVLASNGNDQVMTVTTVLDRHVISGPGRQKKNLRNVRKP